ncbi:MAG TPA: CDP-alcohol phosphatidyltransferase family protein [Candidatus Desulfaltia sp.]|nr:CDP-alcohol phosphatidyltransferase family protein [Candidatus Desulfaltia sp.]
MGLEERITKEKGASDFLAYYVHQPLENWIVARLMHTPVTPNQVTVATNIMAYAVAALFATGRLPEASALSFLVGLMDGLDGKLARAKYMATNLGKLEHAFDLLYEFTWLLALAYFLTASTGNWFHLLYGFTSVTLISFYRMVYDTFGKATGTSLDNYAPFERVFRRVAGRRNLYNIHILAGILAGAPGASLVSITVHAALTAVIYSVRAGTHLNWLDKEKREAKGNSSASE